jgi:hypothetical protein
VWFLLKRFYTRENMNNIKYTIIFSLLLLATGSCKKIVQLPPEPHIEFTSFAIFDTVDILGNSGKAGRLKFFFEDGDGNIGLDEPSGDPLADSTNLFFTLYRKKNGVMVTAPANDPLRPSAYRIPFMERLGQNKILKGTISITFLYLIYNESDTIKYDFYLKDRTPNESNLESTSEIIISENKIYKKE